MRFHESWSGSWARQGDIHLTRIQVRPQLVTHTCRALDELQVEIRWFVNEIKHSSGASSSLSAVEMPLPSDTRRSVILLWVTPSELWDRQFGEVERIHINVIKLHILEIPRDDCEGNIISLCTFLSDERKLTTRITQIPFPSIWILRVVKNLRFEIKARLNVRQPRVIPSVIKYTIPRYNPFHFYGRRAGYDILSRVYVPLHFSKRVRQSLIAYRPS